MTITARNYAAQAQRGLRELADSMLRIPDMAGDARMLKMFAEDIGGAVHFALPDDGVIIDDNLRGIAGVEVRLPYPSITVEYFATGNVKSPDAAIMPAPKRVILAREATRAEVSAATGNNLDGMSDVWIIVAAACTLSNDGRWSPVSTAWAFPAGWSETAGTTPMPQLNMDRNGPGIVGIPLAVMPDHQRRLLDEFGQDAAKSMIHDIAGEVAAVLELCEALSCSNVSHEPMEKINERVAARRARDGKLPIYETRVLVVNAGKASNSGGNGHGDMTRNGPRQHLRRGHIRRLQSGQRVWVNSCVVGALANGKIEKEYQIQAPARSFL